MSAADDAPVSDTGDVSLGDGDGDGAPVNDTDGQALQDALALDELTVEELYEHAPCGYLSLLPSGEIVRVNQTFLDWTAYTRADLLAPGRRFSDLLTAGGRIFYETHCRPMLMAEGSVREIAFDVRSADGHRLPVLFGAETARDAGGTPVLIRATLFDMSHRRSYERQLLASRNAERRAREDAETLRRLTDAVLAATSVQAIDAALVRELSDRAAVCAVEVVRPAIASAPTFTVDEQGAMTAAAIPVRASNEPAAATLRVELEAVGHDQERVLLLEAASIAGRGATRVDRLIAFQKTAQRADDGGLPNRRWWQSALATEVRSAQRAGSPLTLALIEIDDFDRYTQVHGHVAGDRLLLGVSDAWRRAGHDLLSRAGGEELAAILSGVDRAAAVALVNGLRRTPGMHAAFSVGLAHLTPTDSAAELMARAEAALERDAQLRAARG